MKRVNRFMTDAQRLAYQREYKELKEVGLKKWDCVRLARMVAFRVVG